MLEPSLKIIHVSKWSVSPKLFLQFNVDILICLLNLYIKGTSLFPRETAELDLTDTRRGVNATGCHRHRGSCMFAATNLLHKSQDTHKARFIDRNFKISHSPGAAAITPRAHLRRPINNGSCIHVFTEAAVSLGAHNSLNCCALCSWYTTTEVLHWGSMILALSPVSVLYIITVPGIPV